MLLPFHRQDFRNSSVYTILPPILSESIKEIDSTLIPIGSILPMLASEMTLRPSVMWGLNLRFSSMKPDYHESRNMDGIAHNCNGYLVRIEEDIPGILRYRDSHHEEC